MFSTILVPLDGSEHSQMALQVACKLGAKLILLNVPEPREDEPLLVWGLGAAPMGSSLEEREKVGQALLEKAVEAAKSNGMEADAIETRLAHGDPRATILDTAKDEGVDAIVLGSRGLSDFQGLMIGSTSHRISHAAECRVITVH